MRGAEVRLPLPKCLGGQVLRKETLRQTLKATMTVGLPTHQHWSATARLPVLCSRCHNEEVARRSGLTFTHIAFQPMELADANGARHRFHFVLRLLGMMLSRSKAEDGKATNSRCMAPRTPISLIS